MAQPIYRSTDASAPTLPWGLGTLITLLDAVLVNGYGAKSSLGWTKPFSGTNKAVYQQGAGSSGRMLRIDDSVSDYYAHARGAESFSDVDTPSGPFPTVAQLANGIFVQKNHISLNDAKPWIVIGDTKRFLLMVMVHNATTPPRWNSFFFGDPVSFKAGDLYQAVIIGKSAAVNTEDNNRFAQTLVASSTSAASDGHYIVRAHTGVGSSIGVNEYTDPTRLGGGASGNSNNIAYPDPISGGIHLARMFIGEPSAGPRGYIPGIWTVCHQFSTMSGVVDLDLFSGTDGLASKDFQLVTNYNGAIALELSDWPESA